MENGERYPARAFDKDLEHWGERPHVRDISQIDIGRELAHSVRSGLVVRGGPLTRQLPDGSEGAEGDMAVSVVWATSERDDGSRMVLGWYESSRN